MDTSPMGLVFTPAALEGVADVGFGQLDLNGSGFVTIPLGIADVDNIVFHEFGGVEGSFNQVQLVAIQGTGLSDLPLDFASMDIFAPSNPEVSCQANAAMLSGAGIGWENAGTPTTDLLDGGGWVSDSGTPGASGVNGAMLVSTLVSSTSASGQGKMPLP